MNSQYQHILMPTVQHTGSLFLRKVFERAGFCPSDFTHPLPPNTSRAVHMDHVLPGMLPAINVALKRGNGLLVVPMRHPYRVAASFRFRKEPIRLMVQQFNAMMTYVAPFNPIWVPIDVPELMEDAYSMIEKIMSLSLDRDVDYQNVRARSFELDPVDCMVSPEVSEFFRRPPFWYWYEDLR